MPRNLCNSRIFSLCFFLLACFCHAKPKHTSRLKGMFIFGSSVVDSGNNNSSKHLPYGIDFPLGPTGRASNGRTVADLVGGHLGLPFIPSFADTQSKNAPIIHGVNFAFGGSGILNETGTQVVSLTGQVTNFETVTLPKLKAKLKYQRSNMLLDKYLFMVGAGNNDYLFYLIGNNTTPPQDFAAMLLSDYFDQLQRLYNFGARKFLLLSVYPLGCSPAISKGQGCLPEINAIMSMFYDQLIVKINEIRPRLRGAKIIAINSVKMFTDIISNPGSKGFTNVTGTCCDGGYCLANGTYCSNRNDYVYFDLIHTTQALSEVIAEKAYRSRDTSEVYPYNLYELVHFPR